ncbi:MAG TPA: TlpA disulfide reductase family protein [Aestuariivirgaceae bacterium]|jgi:thiol-disulfide isomerase/thioredoxin|nr:TlpA disulfide reductase family protein [Aestuariivirgaceae bacterium]
MIGTAPFSGGIKVLGAIAGIIACVAAIYIVSGPNSNPPTGVRAVPQAQTPELSGRAINKITRDMATGALSAFVVKPERRPMPELVFFDGAGGRRSLSEWRGRVVLLNLWASWCAPCREEMPSFAALQRRFGSKDFEVVAISVDRGGAKVAQQFLDETQSRLLRLYIDPSAKSIETITALGLPATVLIDREGKEVGRLLGPADWTSPEAYRLINVAINESQTGS